MSNQLHFSNCVNLIMFPDVEFSPACEPTVMMSTDELSKLSA